MTDNRFGNLSPGTYLVRGTKATPLQTAGDWASLLGIANPSARQLVDTVGWVFVALRKRRQMCQEIEVEWRQNEHEADPPFVWKRGTLARIDHALQVHGQAFLFKVRRTNATGGKPGRGRMVELRWLDPATISASAATVDENGPEWYYRAADARDRSGSGVVNIHRDDLIIVQDDGLHEWEPMTAATVATKTAAEIMRGIRETADTVFDNNALPPLIVKVPVGTQPDESNRIRDGLQRFFNRRRGTRERSVVGVTENTEIVPLAMNPSDMAMESLTAMVLDEILAAHDVPKSVAVSNAATYATALQDAAQFARTIGGRMQYIADAINADRDVAATGFELKVFLDRHPSQQRDEQMASTAFQRYVSSRMTPMAALWMVTGMLVADFPPEVGDPFEEPPAPPMQLTAGMPGVVKPPDLPDEPSPLEAGADDMKMLHGARSADLKRFRSWYSTRLGADVGGFTSHYLSHAEKVVEADALLRSAVESYP